MTTVHHIAREARTGFFKRLASVNRSTSMNYVDTLAASCSVAHTSDGLTTELQRRRHDTPLPAADATESKWIRVVCGVGLMAMLGFTVLMAVYVVTR